MLLGLQQEVTRGSMVSGTTTTGGVRVIPNALLIGLAVAVLVLGCGMLWSERVWGTAGVPVTLALVALTPLYAGFHAVNGVLAAQGTWRLYGWHGVIESLIRAGAVAAVVGAGLGLGAQAWAIAAGAVTWLFTLRVGGAASVLHARTDQSRKAIARRTAQAMLAAACGSLVIVGFPVLLGWTAPWLMNMTETGSLLAALTMSRAAVMLPLAAVQGRILTHFLTTKDVTSLPRMLIVLALATAALCVPGGLLGPALLRVLMGTEFAVGGVSMVGFVVGAGLLASLTITGLATLAQGRHAWFTLGWVLAATSTAGLLALPLSDPAMLLILASTAGPLLGIACHAGPILAAARLGPAH
jgi:hypothetical protein